LTSRNSPGHASSKILSPSYFFMELLLMHAWKAPYL